MGGEEGFTALQALAGSLGAAVGASLPAVDAGWAPVARQIGQSGKYVSPEVYLGVGLSGTPQHLAGIDPHTRIVAVNKDPEAAIFARARIGVTADWREFLPELARALAAQS
jgi:electron transfer flavoprotein alpha subunit